jgi:threonyl-tRNA synthetase
MKLSLYQKNIMLKIIKNPKIDSEIKILFLVELLYYNAVSLKTANNLVEQYILGISEEAKENLIELLNMISEKNITLGEIKSILTQEVLTTRIENVESNADLVYMMYNRKGTTFLSVLISVVLVVVIVYILTIFAPHTIHNNAYIRDRIKALYLAQEVIEQIQTQPYNLILSQPATKIPGFTGFYKQVDVTNITDTGKIVTVTVTFPGGKTSLSTERYFSPYER